MKSRILLTSCYTSICFVIVLVVRVTKKAVRSYCRRWLQREAAAKELVQPVIESLV